MSGSIRLERRGLMAGLAGVAGLGVTPPASPAVRACVTDWRNWPQAARPRLSDPVWQADVEAPWPMPLRALIAMGRRWPTIPNGAGGKQEAHHVALHADPV